MVQGTMLAAVIPSVLTSAGSLMVGGHTPVMLAAGQFLRVPVVLLRLPSCGLSSVWDAQPWH